MKAKDLISQNIPVVNPSDTCQHVNDWMEETKLSHLPVVEDGQFIGLIAESGIYEIDNWDEQVTNHKKALLEVSIDERTHLLNTIDVLSNSNLTCLPVITEEGMYLGATTPHQVLSKIGELSTVNSPGAIIELEMNTVDYSLAQMSQIVESNNALIIGSFIKGHYDSKKIFVTLKINKSEIGGILQTFERYDYSISASYSENSDEIGIKNRYDNLMNYLNM